MEPHVSLAISKLKSDQRGNVEPGIYEIDEVVHIKGTLRVDEDYTLIQRFWLLHFILQEFSKTMLSVSSEMLLLSV